MGFFHRQIAVSLIIAIFLVIPLSSNAGNPTQFPSVEAMIEDFSDYSESNDTFKILEKNPLHIQLSPIIAQGDQEDVITEMVQRAILYGIYRAFVHTPVEKITVTALPKEMTFNPVTSKDVPKYKQTVSISKTDALNLVKKHLGVTSFSDLVTETNQWTKDFNRLYYNDQGKPGLTLFMKDLAK